jgi:hypothetical protein
MVTCHLDALRKKGALADGVPHSGGEILRVRIPSDQTSLPGGYSLILTGDPYQIDNPYLDATSSGPSHVVERFKESPPLPATSPSARGSAPSWRSWPLGYRRRAQRVRSARGTQPRH